MRQSTPIRALKTHAVRYLFPSGISLHSSYNPQLARIRPKLQMPRNSPDSPAESVTADPRTAHYRKLSRPYRI